MKLRLPHKLQAALIATLAAAAFTTLSTGAAYAEETPLTFGADLGDVMYVGDSITHGIAAASWRWSMHKILVDNGISYDENGYNTGNDSKYSGGLEPGTPYGGVAFENVHSAHSGGDAYEVIGRKQRSGGHYGNTNIYNWLGIDTDLTVRNGTPDTYTYPVTDHVDTFLMLIGTNDMLSSGNNPEAIAGAASDALVQDISDIYGVMQDSNSGSQLVLLSIPTWGTHANNNTTESHQAVAAANAKVKAWADKQANVTYVDVNTGLIDVSSTSIQLKGVDSFYRAPGTSGSSDGLHPNAQGELIIAGNVARAMGYAGRSVGLERSSAAEPAGVVWTTPITEQTTITAGAAAQTVASGVFTVKDGYTVDFNAVYGNGGTDGTWDNANAFSITVGDGTHSGTLSLTEAYVKWDNKILYSKNNSVAGDNLRIAYVNASAYSADNVSAGYYVWLGDQLIGEALTAGSASGGFNGISLQATGADATVTTLSWTNYAYAPTTEGYVNEEAAFKLAQTYPMPTHDNPTPASLNIDFSSAAPANGRYGTDNQPASGELVLQRTGGTETNAWFSPVGAEHSGNVLIKYSNLQAASGSNLISVHGGNVTDGNVAVVLDDGTHLGKGHYGSTGDQSVHGVYGHSLSGALKVEVNNATLDGGILMGVINGNGSISNGTQLLVNKGAVVGGNVYGGGFTGTVNGGTSITITGGSIAGSVYGGGKGGAVNGGSSITISGGIISGNVVGGAEGGTFSGATSVTVDGNLASIGGNIEADTVTLKNVASNTQGYTDGFDYYQGIIRAPRVELVDFTVERFMANIETQSLVLSGGSNTTLTNLTLTACDIDAQGASTVTLDGTLSLGETTTYSGSVALADGLAIDMAGGEFTPNGEYSEGNSGYKMGSRDVMKLKEAAAEGSALNVHAEALVGTGALAGNSFSYDSATGTLTATGADRTTFYVNAGDSLQYSSPVEENPVYGATGIAMNGGSLEFVEALKNGVTLGVTADGSRIIVDDGVDMAVKEITLSTLESHALTLSGTMTASTAAEITANLIGGNANITTTGNISLTNGATSHAGGVLTIGDSLSLNLNGAKGYTYNISSFRQIVLGAGSTINYQAQSATFNNVTLANGDASISITDMGATTDMLTLAGETQLNGHKLSISAPASGNSWKRYVTIEKLVGDDASTLSFEGGKTSDNSGSKITINSLQGFGGTLEFKQNNTGNPLDATVYGGVGSNVNMKALTLDSGTATFRLYATTNPAAAKSIAFDSVTLGNGAKLLSHYGNWDSGNYASVNLSIGSLAMTGDAATVGTTNHGGLINIGSITGNGTLTLTYESSSDVKTIFNLGGADVTGTTFSGTLDVFLNSNGTKRSTTLILNDAYTAANAVVQFRAVSTSNARALGMGINADTVKIAGLTEKELNAASANSSYALFSGDYTGLANQYGGNKTYYDSAGDGKMRTLEITGSGTGDNAYTTGIKVLGNISLAMSGTGSQTFTGDMSQFNGSINVTNGTLNLTPAASSISTHDVHVGENGTLSISATASDTTITAFGTMYNDGSLTLTGAVVLNPADITAFEKLASGPDPVYSGEGDYAGSGYLTTSAHYYLVKGGESSTLNNYITDLTGGSIVSQDTKNIVVAFETSDTRPGTYYVNSALNYDSTEMGGATDFIIAPNATLNSDGSSYAGAPKVLHGKGTYALANNTKALNPGLSLGTDWTGAVRISGYSFANDMNALNSLANSNSWVELVGVHGWSNSVAINANLILGADSNGWSYYQDNGNNEQVLTFNGLVKGTGKFGRSNTTGQHQTHVFTNDISGWTGTYEARSADDRSTTLRLTNNAHEVNATLTRVSGVFNVDVQTDVAFSKAITATTLAVTAGHTATLGANVTLGGLTGAGNIASTANVTITLNGTGTGDNAYTFGGAITGAHLLNKTGAGTQTINGPVTVDRFTISGGTTTFNGLVTGTGAGYSGNNRRMSVSGGTVYFNDGFAYTGDDGYALVTSGGTTHFGGDSDLSGKSIGAGSGSAIVLDAGASLKVTDLMNSTGSKGSGNGTLEMNSGSVLTVAGKMYLTGATSEGGTIHLGNGSTVNLYAGVYQPNIMEFGLGAVVLDGAATTIQTTNWGGTVVLDSIAGNGTLTLKANADSTVRNTFSIGGNATKSEFTGTIALERATGSNRVLLAEFNDMYSAAGAVVQASLSGSHTSEAVGILINSDVVQMKGLKDGTNITSANSYALASGSASRLGNTNGNSDQYLDNASDGTSRTLEIVGDGAYTTAIKVLSGVNLKMSGAGSQTFNGDLSAMNGAVTVNSGTLTLSNSSATAASLGTIGVTGGELVLGGKITYTGSAPIANDGTITLNSDITVTNLAPELNRDFYMNEYGELTFEKQPGFFLGTGLDTLQLTSGTGTVAANDHKAILNGTQYEIYEDGLALHMQTGEGKGVDYTTYYMEGANLNMLSYIKQGSSGQLQKVVLTATTGASNMLYVDDLVGEIDLAGDGTAAMPILYMGDAGGMGTGIIRTDVSQAAVVGMLSLTSGTTDVGYTHTELHMNPSNTLGATQYIRVDDRVQFTAATPMQEDFVFLTNMHGSSSGQTQYKLDDGLFAVAADTVQNIRTEALTEDEHGVGATVGNWLSVRAVHNSYEGGQGALVLTAGVEPTALKEVIATSGDIQFMNMAAANLDTLEIGEGKTVSMYTGSVAEAAQEASVTVSGTLTADAGATLNANLVMASGSTLDVSADGGVNGLLMGSTVTLNKGMNLEDYSSEWSTWEDGTKYALFSGVDGLSIGDAMGTEAIDYTQWVDASEYFTNIDEANRYFLCYDGAPADNQNGVLQASFNGSNVGMVYIMVMPEPTTGTLSLLALCALAARRRHK